MNSNKNKNICDCGKSYDGYCECFPEESTPVDQFLQSWEAFEKDWDDVPLDQFYYDEDPQTERYFQKQADAYEEHQNALF